VINRDFILRQIHQLAQVLAQVLFNKRLDQQTEESREMISMALKDTLGNDFDRLLLMDKESLMAVCGREGGFNAQLAVSVADLMKEEGSEAAVQRAYWLYEAALTRGATLPLQALEWIGDQAS